MSTVKKFFEVDRQHKTFVFTHKDYQELFIDGSEVNKAFKAAMALGCYDGYVPVEKERTLNPDRNTSTQSWSEAGVKWWIELNNPDYLATWEAMGKVRDTHGNKFPFMVKKNLFLYENAAARAFCRIKESKDKPYELKPAATALKTLVAKQLEKDAAEK